MPTHETRDGVTLFYQDWDGAQPVLFAHSWALSSRMWQYQMIALHERGARCVAYDRRGHGRSDQPGGGYDCDRLADDLAEIIERLDLRGLTLVGHSMGCSEITRYLVRHGDERVERVAFVSPVGPFPTRTPDNPNGIDPAMIAATRASWKQDFPAWMDANADAYVGRGIVGDDVSSGLVEWTKNDMLQASLLALVESHRAIADTDQRPELEKIAVPTLVIDGDHDASMPVELSGRVYADLVGGATFKLYENAPHGLYLTHRDQLTNDLFEFVGL